jgi:hypothetical protein
MSPLELSWNWPSSPLLTGTREDFFLSLLSIELYLTMALLHPPPNLQPPTPDPPGRSREYL